MKIPMLTTVLAIATAAALPAMAAMTDADFAREAAQGGMAEVQIGQLVQQKSSNPQVKQFGQMLMQDHQTANQQLMQIARQSNMQVPASPNSEQMAEMKKLQGLSGAQFDQQVAQYEVKDHQQDINVFEQEAQSGKDPALRSFAQQTIPVLQKHLKMAQTLAAK